MRFLTRYSILCSFALACMSTCFAQPCLMTNSFYLGLGGGWNSIDESFSSNLVTSQDRSGRDHYHASDSRLAPIMQIGYAQSFCANCLWGIKAQWQYLNYTTTNVSSSRGQIMPNATFSSINIFGPQIVRDFTALTRLRNEINLLAYLGVNTNNGYVYLGIGPAILTAENSIFVSSVHIPNGVGDHLISSSVSSHRTLWGGIAGIGYHYSIQPNYFIDISYTYLQSSKTKFNNTVNAAILNGHILPGPTTLHVHRSIQFSVQSVAITFNKIIA